MNNNRSGKGEEVNFPSLNNTSTPGGSDAMLINFDQSFTSSWGNGRLKREQDQETMMIDRLRKILQYACSHWRLKSK